MKMMNTSPSETITLCGSMRVIDEMVACSRRLNDWGIATFLPTLDEPVDYSTLPESERAKTKSILIRNHVEKIAESDAVLIFNPTLDDRVNYIGANSFLEMGFAFAFGKSIYLLTNIPDQPNTDEIVGMLPICLDRDLTRLKT